MKITRTQIRKIIKEALLNEKKEMQNIIFSDYENVDDFNILANFALTGDIAGALAHPVLKRYVDKNEMGFIIDDTYNWFNQVGKGEGYLPAPEGWERGKTRQFLGDLEKAAWKVYQQQEDAAIANDPD